MKKERSNTVVNILLVEDDLADIRLVQECFKDIEYNVSLSIVGDGMEALEFLRKTGRYACSDRPEMILLDLNMPRKDGRELLVEMKSDEQLRSIPVIVLTTSNSEKDIAKSYLSGANIFITKPIDFEEFCQVLREIVGHWCKTASLPWKEE